MFEKDFLSFLTKVFLFALIGLISTVAGIGYGVYSLVTLLI
jgi:hypothetical protein